MGLKVQYINLEYHNIMLISPENRYNFKTDKVSNSLLHYSTKLMYYKNTIETTTHT